MGSKWLLRDSCLTSPQTPALKKGQFYIFFFASNFNTSADFLTTTTCRAMSAGRCEPFRKTGLLHPLGSYQKDGNGTLTSVGSMWSVLKCDYAADIISQTVFQASTSHFWTTLVYNFRVKLFVIFSVVFLRLKMNFRNVSFQMLLWLLPFQLQPCCDLASIFCAVVANKLKTYLL
jgi:hypothetical protein